MNVEHSWKPPLQQKQAKQPHLVQTSRALLEPNFFSEERTEMKQTKLFGLYKQEAVINSMSTKFLVKICEVN